MAVHDEVLLIELAALLSSGGALGLIVSTQLEILLQLAFLFLEGGAGSLLRDNTRIEEKGSGI